MCTTLRLCEYRAFFWMIFHSAYTKVIIRFFRSLSLSCSHSLSACHVIVFMMIFTNTINVSQQLIENNLELCRENNLRLFCWKYFNGTYFPYFFVRKCIKWKEMSWHIRGSNLSFSRGAKMHISQTVERV